MQQIGKRCALVAGAVLLLAACSHDAQPSNAAPAPALTPAAGTAPAPAPAPVAGAPARPATDAPASTRPRCAENFKMFDTDGDGSLTKTEFLAQRHWRDDPESIFQARDANGDGVLTLTEFCSGPRGGRGMGPRR